MRIITLQTGLSMEHTVPLFEIGDVMSSAIEGTLAVVEETNEIRLYYSNGWNTIGYADRVTSLLYRERGKENG